MRAALLAALLLCGACAAPAVPAPLVSATVVNKVTIEPVLAPTEPVKIEVAPDSMRVTAPGEVLCAWSVERWSHVPLLSIEVRGPAYARVHLADRGTLFVPPRARERGIVARVERGPVELFGFAVLGEARVFTKVPLLLGGILSPGGARALAIAETSESGLTVAPRQTPVELTDLTAPLHANVTCDQLGLQHASPASPVEVPPNAPRRLLRGEKIPLALSAAGSKVASLQPDPGSPAEVSVIGRAAGWSRMVWSLREGTVIGWVPESSLAVVPSQPVVAYGVGGGGRGEGILRQEHVTRVCPHAVELSTTVAGKTKVVGRVQPQGVLRVLEHHGDQAEVEVESSGIQLLLGAQLLAKWSRIEGCPSEAKAKPQ